MSKVHEILVPVDFSECSNAALRHASLLAEKMGANVHVMHVWQMPEYLPPGTVLGERTVDAFVAMTEEHAKGQLQSLASDAKSRGIRVDHSFTRAGVPSATIVEVAAREGYDLVVMGTNGRTGLAHAFIGSVAERVVRRAPCPVITVREKSPPRGQGVKRILVPVDYSEGSRHALQWATELGRSFGAELDVVHVWDRPAYVSGDTVVVHGPGNTRRSLVELILANAEQEMKDFLAPLAEGQKGGTLQFPPHRLLSGEPASTLITELEKGTHDLVVVGTHGRTGVKHLLLGSIAEKLVRYSPVPVATVPPAAGRS